jgi:biopolymer transport protein TolR
MMTRRIRRKEKKNPDLNLISLMDLFTILVIFLLFQASNDGESLSIAQDLVLPTSTSSQAPVPALTVTVTEREIRVEESVVAESRSVLENPDPVISGLKERLLSKGAGRVTILGDRQIPFDLLKKVMVTCTDAGIEQISLAVLSRE